MCGAALLAGRACLSAGAGMVKIFTHESNRVIIQEKLPEALLDTYTDQDTPDRAADRLRASLAWANIAAAGPGMGTDVTGKALLGAVLDAVQAQTGGPQLVAHTGAQRSFRTDYGKFNIVRLGKFNQFVTVFHTDIDTFGHIGDPRIAGSAIQFFRQRRLAEFPTEGVFTPAGTDHKNIHFFLLYFWSCNKLIHS
jgi:hypothetical protein